MELIFQDTTRGLGALSLAVSTNLPPCRRVPIGLSHEGGVFCFDPFTLYAQGYITNPNVLVLGEIGRGKSAFVKVLLARNAISSFLILDPKGEYGSLARLAGAHLIRLGAHNGADPFAGVVWDNAPSVLTSLTLLVQAVLSRTLAPLERVLITAVSDQIVASAVPLTLAEFVALMDPRNVTRLMVSGIAQARVRELAAGIHIELRRLIDGDLSGVFQIQGDGLALPSRVVVDLSGVAQPELVALAVTVLLRARLDQLRAGQVSQGFVVIDEAWSVVAQEHNLPIVRSLIKLARAFGACALTVSHRVSDFGVSPQGVALVGDMGTFVIFGQPRSELAGLGQTLGIDDELLDLVTRLPRGRALWLIQGRIFLVDHIIVPDEFDLTDTDASMRTD